MRVGKKDGVLKAWEEGKIVMPDDGQPGQLSSRAVDHGAWLRAETNTYEIEYEEVLHCDNAQNILARSKAACPHAGSCRVEVVAASWHTM